MLGGYGRVLVPVTAALAYVLLRRSVSLEEGWRPTGGEGVLYVGRTDFTGEVDMNWVWKLKGFAAEGAAAPEFDVSPSLVFVSSAMLKAKVGVGGRR